MLIVVTFLSLLVAVAALLRVRRQDRKLAQLTEMYWQLKYDHGELKAALKTTVAPPAPAGPAMPTSSFVPLGAIKRSRP